MQLRFGFLYSEYKQKYCYWEILKITQKTIITLILNLYYGNIYIKAILLVCLLFFYQRI